MSSKENIPNVSMFQKMTNYTRALSRWIKAGRPVREDSEIKLIFELHCSGCEAYDHVGGSCRHCGCKVNTLALAPMNKIAMATEECPLEKWERP